MLTRHHYTILAEFAGQIEAGEILPDEVIDELVEILEDIPGSFKRDKFIRHAMKERIAAIAARDCTHEHTRPFSKIDPRPFCTRCKAIV